LTTTALIRYCAGAGGCPIKAIDGRVESSANPHEETFE